MDSTLDFARKLRRLIIEHSRLANVGHIASGLSIVDLVAVIFGQVLPQFPEDEASFVLSKGHAALAIYAALAELGKIDHKDLAKYCQDDTLYGTHPDYRIPGIELSTGSLGMGLGAGAGIACAAHIRRKAKRVYVLLSDGECDEGSVWETAMFAGHHHLSNLVAVIDYNHQQAMGSTEQVLNIDPICERWMSFGWQAFSADGHNHAELQRAFARANEPSDRPCVIVANTIAGYGVSFMERQVKWHYLPMSDLDYTRALAEIDGSR